MATYYASIRVEGTSSTQDVKCMANSGSEAKKVIEMRYGKVKSWIRSPIPAPANKPPPRWFKG